MAAPLNTLQKLQADLLLLEKIERNLYAVNDAVAFKFGKLLMRKICQLHGCINADECKAKIRAELEKF